MKFLRKLHSQREKPGLEWTLLKRLPAALICATAFPLAMAAGARLWVSDPNVGVAAKKIKTMDILAWAVGITGWTAIFTLAIGCVVVVIMKGPAYVADEFPEGGLNTSAVEHEGKSDHDDAGTAGDRDDSPGQA